MAAQVVDLSALSDNLSEDKKDYEKIFGLKMASGFDAKADFTRLGINQNVELIRDELSNLTQPGRTGTTNFTTGAIKQKSRIGTLKPAKVDLLLTEKELYQLRTSYIGRREPGDPKDLHSLPGRTYLMSRIFGRIGQEVNHAIIKGVENPATGLQNGLNLFDGLGVKFTEGYATVAGGGVEDIPASNKVANPVATITEANVLGELKKLIAVILSSNDLILYRNEKATIFIDPMWHQMIENALESALSNGSQVVTRKGDSLYVNALPNTVLKPAIYMIGVQNMFWTPEGNLFYLHQDIDEDIPRMKFQEQDRDLKILIDFEVNMEYADGRLIVLYK